MSDAHPAAAAQAVTSSGGLLATYGWNTFVWVSFLPLLVAVFALAAAALPRMGRVTGKAMG